MLRTLRKNNDSLRLNFCWDNVDLDFIVIGKGKDKMHMYTQVRVLKTTEVRRFRWLILYIECNMNSIRQSEIEFVSLT